MRLSLLVPCYNAENYIDGFLDNISKLAKPFDEIIFYDDASTDNTLAILTAKGLKVIAGEINRGPGHARNCLANATSCSWFHFHDIDDRLIPDYLEKTSSIADQDIADVILCDVDWYDPQQKNISLSWKYSNSDIIRSPIAYTITHPIGGINGLYRKSTFCATPGFNTKARIWEDADLHVRLAGEGARFYVIEEVLSISLRYPNSVSNNQVQGWLTRLNFLEEYAGVFTAPADQQAIGKQAQLTASQLIMSGQYSAAKAALQLSERCKVKVPDSNNYNWVLLKRIIPAPIRIMLRLLQLKIAFNKH